MLANGLSVLRMALAPVVLMSLRRDEEGVGPITLALMLLAGSTDFLDGLAARRLGQVSRLGRILDPVADKVLLGSVCAGAVAWRAFPIWLLGLLLVRDAAILGAGAFLLRSRQVVVPPSLAGKAATWAMSLAILAHAASVTGPLPRAMDLVSAGLLVVSWAGYGCRLWRLLRGGRDAPAPG